MNKFALTFFFISLTVAVFCQDTTLHVEITPIEITDVRDMEEEVITLRRNHFLSYPASFDDPSRLLLKFPAISVLNDQSNFIIYRGMPPHFTQWSMYGAPIVNPNHLTNAGTFSDRSSRSAGGVNMLSGQVIGAMQYLEPTDMDHFGNGLAGIADISLRQSYRDQRFVNLGLIGLEVGMEKTSEQADILVNYRYSTLGVLSAAGVDLGDEEIGFQDAVGSVNFKNVGGGNLRLYGAYGLSSNDHPALEDSAAVEVKDIQDIYYRNTVWMGGINYAKEKNGRKTSATINISGKTEERSSQLGENNITDLDIPSTSFELGETLLSGVVNSKKRNFGYRQLVNLHRFDLDGVDDNYLLSRTGLMLNTGEEEWFRIHTLTELVYDNRNNQVTIEPTISYDTDRWTIAYSYRTMMQSPELYLRGKNEELRRSASFNGSLEYRRGITARLFYHRLVNLPAYYDGETFYHDMAHQDAEINVTLENNGKATIYGLGLGYEKNISNNSKIRINTSIFNNESELTEDTKFNSPYNFGHITNVMWFTRWNLTSSKYLQLTSALHYRGGAYDQMIDLDRSRQAESTIYNYSMINENRLSDYWRWDLRLNYIIQGNGNKQVISLDIQNVTGRQNDAYHYYDPLADEVLLKKQLGLIPILSYRVVW